MHTDHEFSEILLPQPLSVVITGMHCHTGFILFLCQILALNSLCNLKMTLNRS